jgi:DNA-binding SARP family transcriptional activator/tetratricopeptide (TPR) repeat protein
MVAEIWLSGSVLIVADGRAVDVGPPQRRAVLAALAVDAGRVVTAETVIDRVWGDNPPELARRSLHAHVARLRRFVNVVHRAGGYLLDAEVDLHRFRRLVEQAGDVPTAEKAALLRTALTVWRGVPLLGVGGLWADRVRRTWEQRHLDAVIAWAGAEILLGNASSVIGQLTGLVGEHPFHEPLVAVLLRAHQATGNQTAALDLYTATRNRLVAELGVEPGAELGKAHHDVLQGPTGRQPLRVGIVPPAADGFQDRHLAHPGDATTVFSGLGGVGKTQLAAQAARRLWQDGLDLLVWVTAASRDAVVSAYTQAAVDLRLGPPDETAPTRFLAWLASTGRRWLVVLDDVALPADVRGLWPPDHPTGRTIVTTRRRDATLVAGRTLVPVGVFTEQEAVAYLTRKLPAHLADDVPGVVGDLGALPLALSHAAAYMVDQDLTCVAYRARFCSRSLDGLFPDPDTLFDASPRTVATTWTLSIEAADRLPPVGLARPLLELASLLNPNGIPDEVFSHVGSPDDVRDGLRGLYRFNLITHEDGLVRVHALLQRSVRETIRNSPAKAAADALVACWPEVDVQVGPILRANSAALRRTGSSALWDNGMHPLLPRTVDSLGSAAHLTEAVRLCRDLCDQAADRLGPSHPDAFALRNKLGGLLGDAGSLQEAVTCLEKLVIDVTAALGPDHPSTIDARQNLGYQYGQSGELTKAVTELGAAVADRIRTLGPDDQTVFNSRSQLAYWRGRAGDAAGAIASLTELEPRARRVLGPDHVTTLDIQGNLARWLGHSGDHARAAATYDALLTNAVRVLGADHRDVSVYRHNAACWRWQAGDLTGAAAEFEEVLAQRLRMFGPTHRDTLATRHNLASLLAAADDLEAVVADMTNVFGAHHPATLNARSDLAALQNPTALAVVLAEQERVLGPDHTDTIATRARLQDPRTEGRT